MGNVKQALKLITEKLQDVNRAIDFCKDHNEPELLEELSPHEPELLPFVWINEWKIVTKDSGMDGKMDEGKTNSGMLLTFYIGPLGWE